MTVIEAARELGKAIQADERYLAFRDAQKANEEDIELNGLIGKAAGSVAGYYEGADHEWDCYVKPLSADDWLLHLWTPDTFYLRDRELAAICRQHAIPLTGVLMGTLTNAYCLCLAGRLHIYPASAQ